MLPNTGGNLFDKQPGYSAGLASSGQAGRPEAPLQSQVDARDRDSSDSAAVIQAKGQLHYRNDSHCFATSIFRIGTGFPYFCVVPQLTFVRGVGARECIENFISSRPDFQPESQWISGTRDFDRLDPARCPVLGFSDQDRHSLVAEDGAPEKLVARPRSVSCGFLGVRRTETHPYALAGIRKHQ